MQMIQTVVSNNRLPVLSIFRHILAKKYSTDNDEKRNAIMTGPGLEEFVRGEVPEEDQWSNYSGTLVKQKGMKRYNQYYFVQKDFDETHHI